MVLGANSNGLFSGIHDFFSSGTWLVIRNLGIFFVAVFWLSTAYWVYKDARRRVADPVLVGLATLLGLVPPFLGALVYMLFRPPEYLEDVRERELEIRAMEQRLQRAELRCAVCRAEVEPSFLVCPVCTTKLRQACRECKAPLEAHWQICPYCETPVEQRPAFVLEETVEQRPGGTTERPLRAPAPRRRRPAAQ